MSEKYKVQSTSTVRKRPFFEPHVEWFQGDARHYIRKECHHSDSVPIEHYKHARLSNNEIL